MKKYIIITADTNDADYITSKNEISDDQLEEIKPIIKVLQDRKKLFKESKNWDLRHNWECGEIDNGKTPEELYVNNGLLTQNQIDIFQEYLPYADYGLHTIENIEILEISNEEKLL